MHFTRSLAVITYLVLSAAGKVKADCASEIEELSSNQEFIEAQIAWQLECTNLDGTFKEGCDTTALQKICEDDLGADFFTTTVKITECDVPELNLEINDAPLCAPKSCAMDESEMTLIADLREAFPGCDIEYETEGLSSAGFSPNAVTGSLTLLSGVGVAMALV